MTSFWNNTNYNKKEGVLKPRMVILSILKSTSYRYKKKLETVDCCNDSCGCIAIHKTHTGSKWLVVEKDL